MAGHFDELTLAVTQPYTHEVRHFHADVLPLEQIGVDGELPRDVCLVKFVRGLDIAECNVSGIVLHNEVNRRGEVLAVCDNILPGHRLQYDVRLGADIRLHLRNVRRDTEAVGNFHLLVNK